MDIFKKFVLALTKTKFKARTNGPYLHTLPLNNKFGYIKEFGSWGYLEFERTNYFNIGVIWAQVSNRSNKLKWISRHTFWRNFETASNFLESNWPHVAGDEGIFSKVKGELQIEYKQTNCPFNKLVTNISSLICRL